MSSNTKSINYKLVFSKLQAIYPIIAQELSACSVLDDEKHIEEIYYLIINKKKKDSKLLFIAVVLKLYDPDILLGFKKKLRHGIARHISSKYRCTKSAISHNITTIKDRYKIYQSFKREVDEIAYEYQRRITKV